MTARPKTILIVDDDQDMLKLLSKILTTAGFKVASAASVSEAKDLLSVEPPHVVLTDLHMEPENGFEFIQFLRSQKQYERVPLLVLSALNDFSSVKKAIALGVNDYVIKPLQSQMLLRKIRKALLNKDFAKWTVPLSEEILLDVTIDVEVSSLGEAGCVISAPFKIPKGKDIKLKSFELSSIGLDKIVQRSSAEHKLYLQGGMFLNDITFIGISENESSKIRQFISKRNAT